MDASIEINIAIGRAVDQGYDKFKTMEQFQAQLTKKLGKKQKQVNWVQGHAVVELNLYLDPGSQMLRYLLPFISPATVEVRGKWTVAPGQEIPLAARGAAHFGLFGGSPQGMLKVAATTAANKLAKQMLAAKATGFEPVM